VEQKWGLQKYLQELCVEKANMPSNCWQDPNTDIFRFTAVVFGEPKP
jgi:AMMECR1 domain-containing protein